MVFSGFSKKLTVDWGLSTVWSVRVAHAKRMLIHSDLSVDEVSAACGYQDTKYFKQVFKQLTGMSPHAYRQQTPAL